jgi:hypothetical protein
MDVYRAAHMCSSGRYIFRLSKDPAAAAFLCLHQKVYIASLRHVRILCLCVLLLFYILYHPTTTSHPTHLPHDRRRYLHLRNTYTPGRKIYNTITLHSKFVCCSDGYSVFVYNKLSFLSCDNKGRGHLSYHNNPVRKQYESAGERTHVVVAK